MTALLPEQIQELNERFNRAPTEDILRWAWDEFGGSAAIGTSFQGAGLVMMHLAKTAGLPFPVFTIDTGLLFPETVALKQRFEDFFGFPIEVLVPDLTVAQQAAAHGPELWQRDPDLCCTMRKVLPLQAKLGQLDCWITGLRRQQSDVRAGIGIVELYVFDEATGRDDRETQSHGQLVARSGLGIPESRTGFPTIRSTTRATAALAASRAPASSDATGNERAGRWTGFNKTECGIHTFLAKKA